MIIKEKESILSVLEKKFLGLVLRRLLFFISNVSEIRFLNLVVVIVVKFDVEIRFIWKILKYMFLDFL